MAFDKFLITGGQGQPPFTTGMQQDMRPWLIADDSFENLENMFVFRGRTTKRFGSLLTNGNQRLSRLRINLGNTDGSGNITTTIPRAGNVPYIKGAVGQMFSIGIELFTVNVLGTPAVMLTTGASTIHTFDTSTGAGTSGQVIINGAAATTPLFWYPSVPVMGLTEYASAPLSNNANNNVTYGFDTTYAYKYTNGTGWERSGTGAAPIWNGQLDTSFLNFFQACNWKGATVNTAAMFVTNFQVTNYNGVGTATDDPIWYTVDGATWASINTAAANGFYFLPTSGSARTTAQFVVTARIILPFRNRLILLNTVENDNAGGAGVISAGNNTHYPQRCRYSFNGSPLATNAWYEPNTQDNTGVPSGRAAGAGFIDAPTDEQIVTYGFIKDRLIVGFERSVWELAYTGNELVPFVWNKLNDQLGAQSLNSAIPFDQSVLMQGETGIHSCNGSNVVRIDQKIPDAVFELVVKNNNCRRICGIRDFQTEVVYWAVPNDENQATLEWNNNILLYNYRNNTWAIFDDSFTAFGYLEQSSDLSWASSAPLTWEQSTFAWSGNVNAQERIIMAGNQEGFVLLVVPETETNKVSRNAPSLQITDITINTDGTLTLVIINNNLTPNDINIILGDYIAIEDSTTGTTGMTNLYIDYANKLGIYPVISTSANSIIVQVKESQMAARPFAISGTYRGGATAARVSNTQLITKQWNPYDKESRNVYIQKIDFAVQRTESGAITVDYFPSSTQLSMIQEGQASGSIMGTGVLETSPYTLYPLEEFQERLWHPVYFQSSGECIQLYMYMSDEQMRDPNISWSALTIEAFLLWTQRTSSRLE